MKPIIKTLSFVTLISSAVIFVSGCNTVQGAFQGAGKDTKALVNGLHLNNPPKHHVSKQYSSGSENMTTTTRTYTTKTTTGPAPLSPNAVESTPETVQPQ